MSGETTFSLTDKPCDVRQVVGTPIGHPCRCGSSGSRIPQVRLRHKSPHGLPQR